MPRARRLSGSLVAIALVIGALITSATGARGDDGTNAQQQSRWPAGPGASPRVEGVAHALRFLGADRFETNLAVTLALRGKGGFPYTTSDRTSGGASSLGAANGWWGARSCPKAVIVVAGDNFADALAATSLSDPTSKGAGPLLERVAAADPLFDPIGGFARVAMGPAPIIVTTSGRQGATTLSISSRIAAQDMVTGGCTTARSAVIVGGAGAVPRSIEPDLLSLGYTQVFRVAGVDRFDTAARVAQALGTKPVPDGTSGCLDPDVSDSSARMGWYAPSVVELRESSGACRLLGRTVVLADGGTGADALAAGWWTSFWQVPVLLTTGDGTLSPATRSALQATAVNNLIVLGGPARIPDATVNEAQSLTGAAVVRIAGADRYATAVEMAERLGGWWPTGDAADSSGSMVCLAASGGEGSNSVGWPDALGAGPLCAALNGAAANPGAPARALPPAAGLSPAVTTGARPTRDAVPVLLVAPQSEDLPGSTQAFLAALFPSSSWCSSATLVPGCSEPGFAVAFGGRSVVSDGALLDAAALVSGGNYQVADDLSPSIASGFTTSLDLSPVFAAGGGVGPMRQCYPRAALFGLRWLSVYADSAASQFDSELDVMTSGRYVSDADGTSRSPGASAPVCVLFNASQQGVSAVGGVSLSGRTTPRTSLSFGVLQRMTLSTNVALSNPTGSGAASESTSPAVGTTWIFSGTPLAPVTVTVKAGAPQAVTSATLNVTVTRGGGATSPNTLAGTLSLATSNGVLNGTVSGEALLTGGAWHLRGNAVVTNGTIGASAGSGGFTADITLGNPGTGDDTIAWNIDGVVS
jgi:putative cell wall-binding protein